MTAHQDVAGVVDVERQIREMGFDAVMAQNLAEIVRISEQAGKDESAAEIARLSKALSEAEAELEELRHAFDSRWEANMRAIKIWQAANPDRGKIWPDHADMVVWLLDRDHAAEARLAEVEADRDRISRNRDMWKGQVERQAEQLAKLRVELSKSEAQNADV